MKRIQLEKGSAMPLIILVLLTSTFMYFIIKDIPSANALTDEELKQGYVEISSSPLTGSCGGLNHPIDEYMKGACCGEMNLERYETQRRFIEKEFGKYEVIPKDPWNVPTEMAQRLTQFDKTVILNAVEQKIYDDALKIFDEGPCCCKCWRWFAFNGLAKHLIQEEGFNAQQIAEMWASEDVCGDNNPYEELEET